MERGAAHFEKFFDKILEYHFGTKITTAALEFVRKLKETYFSVVTYLPLKFATPPLLKNLIAQNLPPPPPPKNSIVQDWPPTS